MTSPSEAWAALNHAVDEYIQNRGDVHANSKFHRAVMDYAKARSTNDNAVVERVHGNATSDPDAVFKFGKLKGQPLTGAPERDLNWYAGALRKSIEDPDKARWVDSNRDELAKVEAVMGR